MLSSCIVEAKLFYDLVFDSASDIYTMAVWKLQNYFRAPLVLLMLSQISSSFILQAAQATATPLAPSIIVFGDSTLDAGMNNNLTTLVKANFQPYGRDFMGGKPTGRFTNGKVPVDFVALKAGLPMPLAYFDPQAKGQNIVQGISFASAGSGYNDNTAKFFNVISLTKQLILFQSYQTQLAEVVGTEAASRILSEAVYVLSTGSNDYANNYFFNMRLKAKMNEEQYKESLLQLAATFFTNLYNMGARRLAVISIPPLGCLPAQRRLLGRLDITDCVQSANEAALSFNNGLESVITAIKVQYTDFRIVMLDSYAPLLDMYQNPAKYGIEEVKNGCCATGTVETAVLCNKLDTRLSCADASKYMFWDSFHPTEPVYEKLANIFFQEGLAAKILS